MNRDTTNRLRDVDMYPSDWLSSYTERRINLSGVRDVPGLRKTLDGMEFAPFPYHVTNLTTNCPFLVLDDPQSKVGDQRFATGALFKSGPNYKKTKLDGNFFSNRDLWTSFKQNGEPISLQFRGERHGPIKHTWTSYGSINLPETATPLEILRNITPYNLNEYFYSDFGSHFTPWLTPIFRMILVPPREKKFDFSWVTFNPPLILESRDIAIYALLTKLNPRGYYPSDHPSYDSTLHQIVDSSIPHPFATDAWFCPKWGARVDGTLVEAVYLKIEKFFLTLGDYISNRTGVVLYKWEVREWCCYYFDWMRELYYAYITMPPKTLTPLTGANTPSMGVLAQQATLLDSYEALKAYAFRQHDSILWTRVCDSLSLTWLDTFMKTAVEQVALLVSQSPTVVGSGLISFLLIWLIDAYTSFCSLLPFPLLRQILSIFFTIILFFIKAIFKLAIKFVFFGASLTAACLLNSALTLSWLSFLFWILVIYTLYKIIDEAELKYFFSVMLKWQVPTWAYTRVLTTYKAAWLLLCLCPLIINIIFSTSGIFDPIIQRALAVVFTGFLSFYYFVIWLVYNGVRLPFLRLIPFVKRHYILYFRKCKGPKAVVFNMETRFDLWWAYPLVPFTVHKWWHGVKLRYWSGFFLIKLTLYFLLSFAFFVMFSINLEGLVGPIMYLSWSDIFRNLS